MKNMKKPKKPHTTTIRQKAKLKCGVAKVQYPDITAKWKVMVDAMVPNGNSEESERDNTIITINMQPLLQNDTQKKREPQLKYYEMGECKRRTEKIVEHWIKE